MSGGLEILVAIDALDDEVHAAKAVPLTDQVRFDPEALQARVAEIRAHWPPRADSALLDELDGAVAAAPAVPLTRQVRIDKERIYDLLDRMRAELPDAIREIRRREIGVHHVALEIREDATAAEAAFWSLLGFARVEPPGSLAGRAVWVERAGTQIHLLLAEDPVAMPEGHVAVVTEDYDTTLVALRAAGFEPQPRTEHWGSPRAFVRSPAGHRVEVMAFPPG